MSARGRLRRLLPNLALLAVSLLLVLGAAELVVRLFVDLREYKPIAVHDVDPDNPNAFLPNHERVYETSEFRYTVSFNRFGRRDVEWPPETVADPRGVLFVGDSFVLGNGVEHESTIPTRLEALFAERGRPREVFNFGMPGGGPPTYLELLEEAFAAGFAARTVMVGVFVGNDFYPNVLPERRRPPAPARETRTRRWLPRSELAQFLRLRLVQSPRVVSLALGVSGMLGISLYDTAGSYIFLREPTAEQSELFDAILAHVGRMQELCDGHGRRLHVVIFPNRIQVENQEALSNAFLDAQRPNQRIQDFCRQRGLDCLDLLPVLRAHWKQHGEALFFPIDRHLNPNGTRVAARAIADFLPAPADHAESR